MENFQCYLRQILEKELPEISNETLEKVVQFYGLVLKENQFQNLTRFLSPIDFFNGHVLDVWHLLKTGWLQFPAADIGSGVGVPGFLAIILSPALSSGSWILIESEIQKSRYLTRLVDTFKLSQYVEIFSGRLESALLSSSFKKRRVQSFVARAVGPVSRIYKWIHLCSTWNNLILLKGPGWKMEWLDFQKTSRSKFLSIKSEYCYSIRDNQQQRIIVELEPLR